MKQMAAEKQSVDVVFLDPPRSGSTEEFMDSMISINPKNVVYISCNPATLERDLSYLVKRGYEVKKAIPVDNTMMFLCSLGRKVRGNFCIGG